MDAITIGIIGFIVMFVLMFMGTPIGIGMAVVGFGGMALIGGVSLALNQLGTVPYANVASFTLAVLPMFILMGEWAHNSGLTEGAFTAAHKALGRLPGGLAMSTIGTCAIFAACTGSSLAGAATMAKVAYPSMRKVNYDPGLSLGAIAAGGTLGILIPPSNPMILYAILTGTSVGKLFLGGFIPGLLLTTMFMLTIYIICKVRPEMGAAGEKASIREVFAASKGLWPGIFLAAVVLVGMWGGVFSPSEAGAIGAFIALLIILLRKGFAIPEIIDGLKGTLQTVTMIFLIVIGAMIFGDFLTLSGLPEVLTGKLQGLSLSPNALLALLMLVYIILGAIMDELAMVLITLPVVFPIVSAAGIDPVLFGILLTIVTQIGLIAPPVGMVVFMLSGIVKEVPLYTIYKGALPFFATMVILIGLVIVFPEIALWLPQTIRR